MISRVLIVSFLSINMQYAFANVEPLTVNLLLHSQVLTHHSSVDVGEVAQVYAIGNNASIVEKIKRTPIIVNDLDSISQDIWLITNTQLYEILKMKFPEQEFIFHGRVEAKIKKLHGLVNADLINSTSKDFLTESLKKLNHQFEIKRLSYLEDRIISHNNFYLKARRNEIEFWQKRECIWIDIRSKVDDSLIDSVPVWYKVSIYAPSLVNPNNIEAGEELRLDHFTTMIKNIAGVQYISPEEFESNSYRSTVHIANNKILSWDIVEKTPIIERGEKIKVISLYKNIVVQSDAIALSEGNVGEQIKLKMENQEDNKFFIGTIESGSTARVTYGY